MPEFLNEKGLSHYLDRIITNSNRQLFLISPFLCIPERIITKINLALNRNVEVNIIYGIRDRLKPYEQERLQKLGRHNLFFHSQLHAKAYFNENEAIVTSLNLSDAADDNRNHEFGIYFTKKDSLSMYESLVKECTAILNEIGEINHNVDIGYCIRCRTQWPLDPTRPLCISCYLVWEQFRNANYPEKYCHFCGVEAMTSMNSPICLNH